MAERFKQIVKNEKESYIEDCPVMLEAYAILRDLKENRVLIQLKLKNCAKDTIKSVTVSVNALNHMGDCVEIIEAFHYLDVNATSDESFGTKKPIYLFGDAIVKTIEVFIDKVEFSDGTIWEPAERTPFSEADAAAIIVKYTKLLQELEDKQFDDSELTAEIVQLEKKKAELSEKLSSLGFFKSKEKKQLQWEIKECELKIEQLQGEISDGNTRLTLDKIIQESEYKLKIEEAKEKLQREQ